MCAVGREMHYLISPGVTMKPRGTLQGRVKEQVIITSASSPSSSSKHSPADCLIKAIIKSTNDKNRTMVDGFVA
jgi:hypothetical protein